MSSPTMKMVRFTTGERMYFAMTAISLEGMLPIVRKAENDV